VQILWHIPANSGRILAHSGLTRHLVVINYRGATGNTLLGNITGNTTVRDKETMADPQDDYGDGQDYSDDESEVQVTGTRRLPKQGLAIEEDNEEDDEDDEVEEVEGGDDDDEEEEGEEEEQQAGRSYTQESITCNVDDYVSQASDISRSIVLGIGRDDEEEAIDMTGFIEVPTSAFDIPFVRKNKGKGGWTCLHCHLTCEGNLNATKLKAHLARVPGHDITTCDGSKDMPLNYRDMYRRQFQEYLDKRARNEWSTAVEEEGAVGFNTKEPW
jgi:hypothetical protein